MIFRIPLQDSKAKNAFFGFLAFFLYLGIFVGVYREVIFGHQTFFRRDILRFYYPVWHYAVEMMKKGVIPLWDPFNYCGTPFFANTQTCVLYPLTLFFYFGDFTRAFNFYILWHLAMASLFTYLWMRDCGVSKAASLIAGFAFGMGGYMMSTINLTISLCSSAYFPLVLLAFRRSMGRKDFFWRGITAVTLLLQYLAGDPSIAFITAFVLTVFSLYKTGEKSILQKAFSFGLLSNLFQILLVFLALSAFQTLLFGEYLFYSNRLYLDFYEKMLWSVQYNDLLGIVIPFFTDISMYLMNYWVRQSWLENGYAGVTVVCLAVVGWVLGRKKDLIAYHVLMAVLGIALALGQFSLFYPILHKFFPLLSFVRYPVRFFFLFSFAAACLAGFGVDLVLERGGRRRSAGHRAKALRWAGFLCLGVLVILLAAIFFSDIQLKLSFWIQKYLGEVIKPAVLVGILKDTASAAAWNTKRSFILGAMILVGVASSLYLKPRRSVAVLFFATLVVVDLATANAFEPSLSVDIYQKIPKNVAAILKDKTLSRVMASPKTVYMQIWGTGNPHGPLQEDQKELLISNYIMLFGIQNVTGYNSVFLKSLHDIEKVLMTSKWPAQTKLMNMLNIKYLVSPKSSLTQQFELVNATPVTNIFRNKNVLPRAYLVKEARVEKDRKRILEAFTAEGFDPKKQLFVEEEPRESYPASLVHGRILSRETLGITEYQPQSVTMSATVSERPWLFFSDAYYPGWKAWVDGRPAKIYRANYAFRALYLSKGTHQIIWKYDPPLFKSGLVISALTFLALLVYYTARLSRSPSFRTQ